MAIASLGKTVVYRPPGSPLRAIGAKMDLTTSQAAIITRVESGTTVTLKVFLDHGDEINVPNVKNDDTMSSPNTWAYPV